MASKIVVGGRQGDYIVSIEVSTPGRGHYIREKSFTNYRRAYAYAHAISKRVGGFPKNLEIKTDH